MIRLVALACGFFCGIGLTVSGLYRPAALQNFLNPADIWDPTLGLALIAAVIVAAIVLALTRRHSPPLLGGKMEPVAVESGWKPMIGGVLFGLGWGLAGYFPLAAFVSLGHFAPGAAVFLASVLGGMIVCDVFAKRGQPRHGGGRSRG